MNDRGSSAISLLVGVVAGAVLGVLFAPKSGKQTRQELRDWLDEKREAGSEILHKIPETKERLVSAVRAGAETFEKHGGRKERVEA